MSLYLIVCGFSNGEYFENVPKIRIQSESDNKNSQQPP